MKQRTAPVKAADIIECYTEALTNPILAEVARTIEAQKVYQLLREDGVQCTFAQVDRELMILRCQKELEEKNRG